MKFNNCTLGSIKALYLKKVTAIEKNDKVLLTNLKENYPELFDAKFLMDVLKNEFERIKNNLDDDVIFVNYLFQYH